RGSERVDHASFWRSNAAPRFYVAIRPGVLALRAPRAGGPLTPAPRLRRTWGPRRLRLAGSVGESLRRVRVAARVVDEPAKNLRPHQGATELAFGDGRGWAPAAGRRAGQHSTQSRTA